MVGAGEGGLDNELARVSVVDYSGKVILDTFVKPRKPVTDYRTAVSGVHPEDLEDAPDFKTVQNQVKLSIKGKFVVGHSLYFDFKSLKIYCPKELKRDTALYPVIRAMWNGSSPSLKNLAFLVFGIQIQDGIHDSVEDAMASMIVYRHYENQWEEYVLLQGSKAIFEEHIFCYYCGHSGHMKYDCEAWKKNQLRLLAKQESSSENQEYYVQ
ncbi:980_t:CDS:2 [Paraglomus occultum]|uniref:RNA exonuclease 4 n=1 Tax=Paraglomus occultum TaxID=144539 RepID=A0A9N9B1L3_9GLOM|nr:980_t:CDS:2 [Paraglomus occultum]